MSDDEDEDEEEEAEMGGEDDAAEVAAAAEAARAQRLEELAKEFKIVFKNYRTTAAAMDWRNLNERLVLGLELPPVGEEIELMDLWKVDMGKVMKYVFIDVTNSGLLCGFLPKMAFSSRGSIGSFLASSFNERINSKANQKVTKGNVSLDPAEVNMTVVLGMNRGFMKFMREHYPEVAGQHFNMTVITLADNAKGEVDVEVEVEGGC